MQYLKDIERFTQKKTVSCGIDVHKHHWDLCFMCDSMLVEKKKISSDVAVLLAHVDRYYPNTRELRFVYEAGFSGFHLYRQLEAAGYSCTVTPPNRVPSCNDKVKTDKRDAQKLAQYHAGKLLKEVFVPPASIEADRQIMRLRYDYRKKLNRIKNQIKSLFNLHGIEKPVSIRSCWSKRYVAWLESIEFEHPSLRMVLDKHLQEYGFYRSQMAEITRQLRTLSKSDPYQKYYKILYSCPGIGLITAMTFLLELADITRFPSAEDFSSYLGLTPSQFSSGPHVRMGHITREGNAHLRRVLIESAWTVIRYDPFLQEKYNRIRAKGTNGKKAIVGVARSLAVRLRRCLLDEMAYELGIC